MASRKKFLPEAEIQELERLVGQELIDHLSNLSHEALIKLTALLLNSYRIVARVANAAARLITALKNGEDAQDTVLQLQRCLADYMPNNFSLHVGDLEVVCDELNSLYEQLEAFEVPEVLELVGDRIIYYEQQLQKLRAQGPQQLSLPMRTPVKK